jgi:oligoendopeptidase F
MYKRKDSNAKKICLGILLSATIFSFYFFSTKVEDKHLSVKRNMLPKWNLADLYKSSEDPQLNVDKEQLEKDTLEFAKNYQNKISENMTAEILLKSIKDYEALSNKIQKIAVYARLYSFLNLDDPKIQSFFQETVERLTALEQKIIFYTLAINALPEDRLTTLIEQNKELGFYKPWLRRVRAFKEYQLEEKLEQLLADKSITSNQMWSRLYDESLAKLRFDFKGQSLGVAAITNLQSHINPEIRKESAEIIAKTLKENGDIFVTITNVLAKDLELQDKWRNFKNLGDSRHLANDVEAVVINNLKETVKNNYKKLSHRFYALKAKMLGVEKISYWDRNAPLPSTTEKEYAWEEAKNVVLNAYKSFSPTIHDEVLKFFDNGWIDAAESPKKYSGAFNMPTFQGHHPYVLLNYKGKLRDVATLAHELGHGIHSTLADHQGILMANAPLTLCETASVFGEMLTFQYLLKNTSSAQERIQALEGKISDMVNTVVRQIAFYDFECRLHEQRRLGKELSREDINQLWLTTQKEALGSYVDVPDTVKEFWMLIPHFIHSPFYVYSYAFGDCLVNSLYKHYQEHPDGFEDKYIELLKAGGTKHHSELLKPFNLNAADPSFWQNGLDVVIAFIDQLEEEIKKETQTQNSAKVK